MQRFIVLIQWVVLLGGCLMMHQARGAVITRIDDGGTSVDLTTAGGWRDPAIAKPKDMGEDNRYGTDGFYLFEFNHPNWGWSARNTANDVSWLPTYITSVTDDMANAYGDDTNYGKLNDPADYNTFALRGGRDARGGVAWAFNTITIVRNGSTGAFRLTVFATFSGLPGPEQVWVQSGADPQVGGVLYYQTAQTSYCSFLVGAGTENITVKLYSGGNSISGIAFDGLAARPYNEPSTMTHYNCDTVGGGVHYAGGGVSISAPTASAAQVYEGTNSAAITFDTGAAGATYGAINMWPAWRSVPVNMRTLRFASFAPVGTVFQIGLECDGLWVTQNTPVITQQSAGWEWHQVRLSTMGVIPSNFPRHLGTIRAFIYGSGQGGTAGISGTLYLDRLEFAEAPQASPSAAALDFATWDVANGQSPAQTVTITNDGSQPLAFTGAGITLNGTDAADFVITNSPATTTLAVGASRTIDVVFDPTVNGAKTASLRLLTTDPVNPTQDIPLTGGAVPVELSAFTAE